MRCQDFWVSHLLRCIPAALRTPYFVPHLLREYGCIIQSTYNSYLPHITLRCSLGRGRREYVPDHVQIRQLLMSLLASLGPGGSWLFPAEAQTRVKLPQFAPSAPTARIRTHDPSPSRWNRLLLWEGCRVDKGTRQVQISGCCSPSLGPFPIPHHDKLSQPQTCLSRLPGSMDSLYDGIYLTVGAESSTLSGPSLLSLRIQLFTLIF